MPPLATIGILSIGDMGMGIAKLLIAHNYRVVTNLEGRSADTASRVRRAAIESLPTDTALVSTSDYILSIVPPRDALSTARRITAAFTTLSPPKPTPLYYLDLNAISPRTAKQISSLISSSAPTIKFIDGGIIGGAPKLKEQSAKESDMSGVGGAHPPSTSSAWGKPYIPLSGPSPLSSAPISGAHLAEALNTKHIANEIGPASGLKCCFASLSKGFTALCIQSFTTASNMGVLEELKGQLEERMPGMLKAGSGGVTGMPPKAYRWVREMEEIGITHAEEGGFEGGSRDGEGVFGEIAKVYRSVAEETVLGKEKTESRKRGLTIDDVASAMGEGLKEKRKKME